MTLQWLRNKFLLEGIFVFDQISYTNVSRENDARKYLLVLMSLSCETWSYKCLTQINPRNSKDKVNSDRLRLECSFSMSLFPCLFGFN